MWICFFFFLFIFVNYLFILVVGREGGGLGLVDNKLNYKTNWYDINIGFFFFFFTKMRNALIPVTIERVAKISKRTTKKFPSHELLFKLPSIYSQSVKILKEKHPWTLWKYRAHKQNTASKWPKKKNQLNNWNQQMRLPNIILQHLLWMAYTNYNNNALFSKF